MGRCDVGVAYRPGTHCPRVARHPPLLPTNPPSLTPPNMPLAGIMWHVGGYEVLGYLVWAKGTPTPNNPRKPNPALHLRPRQGMPQLIHPWCWVGLPGADWVYPSGPGKGALNPDYPRHAWVSLHHIHPSPAKAGPGGYSCGVPYPHQPSLVWVRVRE